MVLVASHEVRGSLSGVISAPSLSIIRLSSTECTQSVQGIQLKSSLESDGRTAACPGETVVYTCTTLNTGALQWVVESFHSYTTE